MGLAVLIITVSPMVSLVLLVVVIHSGDVSLVWLYADLFNCKRCVPLKDRWVDWCKWFALRFCLRVGRWWDFLELGVLRMADELFPIIIILVGARVVMTGGFATASAQIVLTICVREVAG